MDVTQLDQMLKFLTETLQQGKDFTVEQAPQFVRELLLWRFYESAVFAGVFVALALIVATNGASWAATMMDDEGAAKSARKLMRLVAAVIAVAGLGVNGYTMVQVKVAPRVVLVEMVRNLIAGPRR